MRTILFVCLLLWSQKTLAQEKPKIEFDGQFSIIGSYSPEAEKEVFLGGRYLPELNLDVPIDSLRSFAAEVSANVAGNTAFHPFSEGESRGEVGLYRAWARYTHRQIEVRAGLQKIDFGAATILRPLQWFNQIDPRDPLQLTNGVYGVLGRYYFLNNANIWLWTLYGNEKTRGFDAIETNARIPEFGGRVQLPVPKGEIAFSYHHRTANSSDAGFLPVFEEIPENRFGLDGKWDLGIGLWAEASVVHKAKDLGIFTTQSLLNVGTDYTFGIGNGLNAVVEHLVISNDSQLLTFENTVHLSAIAASYPLGFFDNLNAVLLYSWSTKDVTFNLNYEHQFKKFTGYVTIYYNPDTPVGFQQNDLVNLFPGPGIRLTAVYNH